MQQLSLYGRTLRSQELCAPQYQLIDVAQQETSKALVLALKRFKRSTGRPLDQGRVGRYKANDRLFF
jgi:hypothetical protein